MNTYMNSPFQSTEQSTKLRLRPPFLLFHSAVENEQKGQTVGRASPTCRRLPIQPHQSYESLPSVRQHHRVARLEGGQMREGLIVWMEKRR